MLVTFISQCEKKALNRTRRVLDAFANRIGDNVWHTAITEDGLDTVRRLLKSSATKSTAVSCHRVKTRQRSELIWVVGRKDAFNYLGYVPVNWTTKELPMDLPIETKTILANTHGQALSQHLFAVGFLAYHLIGKLEINSLNLAKSAFIAGVLHDIGKLDPQFQTWVCTQYQKSTKAQKPTPTDEPDNIELPEDGVHIDKGKFSFETHPRHHEISWLLASSLLRDASELNSSQLSQIYHAIYWHHTRPYRKEEKYFDRAEGIDKLWIKSLSPTMIEHFTNQMVAVLKDVKLIADKFMADDFNVQNLLPKWNYTYQLCKNDLPAYKNYNDLSDEINEFVADIKPNALNNLVRMAVITADRLVSKMPSEDLNDYLADGSLINVLDELMIDSGSLQTEIQRCLDGFNQKYPNSERNQKQSIAATQLAELQDTAEFEDRDNVAVLQGPAGCGKTKIALEWGLKTNAQKIIWVCPRVQVCLGILQDLTQADYLPNSNIEIFTGEFKKILTGGQSFENIADTLPDNYFSGDIVITTIDQVLNNIISHQKVTGMVDFMQSHVVFDEFHELIPMPAFNLLFAELTYAKKMRKHHANTLLVSATPHDYFVKEILGIDKAEIVRIDSFNQADYQIQFEPYDETAQANPLVINKMDDDKTTFVITNTAQEAQLGFLLHQNDENAILLHSKYTKQDKAEWFAKVYNSFKQNGSGEYQILRSGQIVQASLNISCERMYSDLTSAENWLQRLGRLDRFDGNNAVDVYTTVYPENLQKNKGQGYILNEHLYIFNSTKCWLDFIQRKLNNKTVVKINELYEIYQEFYTNTECEKEIKKDLEEALKEGVRLMNYKMNVPISIPARKTQKDSVAKIASVSLRGDSRFVQMAVCEVDSDLKLRFLDEYAYPEDTDHSKITVGLTESTNRIQGGKGEGKQDKKDLLAFMSSVHETVMKYKGLEFPKIRNGRQILGFARSPEFPIYLSYTPTDLKAVLRNGHQYAMYYVKTTKQPVGMMSRNKLENLQKSNDDNHDEE
ncbi:CRISPR-associated helicase Cas3' [Kingella negevensis]|uniref:CRISPR-associated helicase Cas3' n=1 Tax=Kingella negevensis TaxID=1522312 RepID=UPI00254A3BDC|nr:CRISPR-associated helicase Cas3' [Kingella negevensis]MDK4706853.1 CRISPR-associated helicase Cas3' [Kingella negevensis]MDK4710434.1 CRISPR-associated helicase Cas3' [Kingella negevensis]